MKLIFICIFSMFYLDKDVLSKSKMTPFQLLLNYNDFTKSETNAFNACLNMVHLDEKKNCVNKKNLI